MVGACDGHRAVRPCIDGRREPSPDDDHGTGDAVDRVTAAADGLFRMSRRRPRPPATCASGTASLEAVRGVWFEIHEGETYGLLGPERRGQDDDDLDGLRPAHPRRRRGARWTARPIDVGAVAAKAGHRVRAPGARDLPRPVGAREPRVLRPAVRPRRRRAQAHASRTVLELIGLDRPGEGPHRPRSAAACSAGSTSASACSTGRGCCCSTSRPWASTRRAGTRSSSRSPALGPGRAWRSCTRPTTWRRRSASAIGSGSSTRARSAPRGRRRELVALIGGQDQVRLALTGDVVAAAAAVGRIDGVTGADAKDGELEILVADAHRALPRLLDAVAAAGAHGPRRGPRLAGPRGGVPPPHRPRPAGHRGASRRCASRSSSRRRTCASGCGTVPRCSSPIVAPLGPRGDLQPAAGQHDRLRHDLWSSRPGRRRARDGSCARTSSASLERGGVAVVTTSPTEAEARAAVEDGTADVAFIIPPGLHRRDPRRRRPVTLRGRRGPGRGPRDGDRPVASPSGSGTASSRSSCRSRRCELAGGPGAAARRTMRADRRPGGGGRCRRPSLVDAAGRAPPAQPRRPTSRAVDGDPVPVLRGAGRDGQPVRGAAGGDARPDPRRARSGRETVLAGKNLGLVRSWASSAMAMLVVATTLLIGADWGPPIGVAADASSRRSSRRSGSRRS